MYFHGLPEANKFAKEIQQSDIMQADLVLEVGFKPDRKYAQVTNIFQIYHNYKGLDSSKRDNDVRSLLGYLIIFQSMHNEKLAEVYKLPNPSLRSAELFSRMMQTVLPNWFGEVEYPQLTDKDGPDDVGGAGVFASLTPVPPQRGPGYSNQLPKPDPKFHSVTVLGQQLPELLAR
jgi:hypothetical protein